MKSKTRISSHITESNMNTPFSSGTNIDTNFHQEKTRITDEAPKHMEIIHRHLSHQDGIKMLTTDRLLLC